MNILITLNNFSSLTGSEIQVYELSRILAKRKHKVTILANKVGEEIARNAVQNGVNIFSFFDHPEIEPDIVHAQQPLPTTYTLVKFPATPHVVTIHSTLMYENPILDPHIKRYIVVRPDIQEKYKTLDPVLIVNGVDTMRFNLENTSDNGKTLFVGTNDYLRQATIANLQYRQEKGELNVEFIGEGFAKKPLWFIENEVKTCRDTASIYMGRTTIEGWMCGKPGWIYDIDEKGQIQSLIYAEIPKDLTSFDSEYMTDRILEVYEKAL